MTYPERFGRISGLIILQPLVITFILLTSYPVNYNIPTPFWFIILSSFMSAAFFLLLQNWLSERVLLYLIFIADIPLIGTMVYYTGGIESMFPFFYLLLIIVSSIYLFRNGAYIISLISVIFFLGLLLFEIKAGEYPVRYVMYRFYLFALLFLFTAILSGGLSERYKLRTEEVKRLKLTTEEIIKNLPSGIITVDNKGDIIYTNINDDYIRSRVHLHITKFLRYADTPNSIELRIKKRYYLLSCARIYNSQAALGILQDLTDVRRLEESSRISKQTKMLAELGGSLAHEIRNPLSSIRGALEVIAKEGKNKKSQPFINMAVKESTRLNDIVTDFLNFAQFTPSKMNRVLISEVVTEALLETAQRFSDKTIDIIRQGDDFYVIADLNRLKSGFVNILNNAYEVSKNSQKIIIRTHKDKEEGYVEIIDQGHGISKKDLKKIFTPFFTTKKGGTGLGLSIAQKVVEAHHGRIEVTSRIGKGTTSQIILPLA